MKPIIVFSIFLFFINCTDPNAIPIPRTEKLEVFTIKQDNGEYVKDKLKFAEAFVYGDQGQTMDHFILDEAGNIINKEKMSYNDSGELTRSEYYNMFDSLLSYYTYEFPNDKLEIKKSYDALNNELLRVERIYKENTTGQIQKKEVFTANDQLERTINFKYDEHGNEIYFSIMNAIGERIKSEAFKLTKMDEHQQWLERWGFENDKPISCRVREFGYTKKAK